MKPFSRLLHALLTAFTRPPTPCCAAAVNWANFR